MSVKAPSSSTSTLSNSAEYARTTSFAPSAGFAQGWGFLVLDNPADIARFRDVVRSELDPDGWFAAQVEAPLLIIPHSNKDAYLDRYAMPDKGFTDRSDAWWPAPYWDIDTGFASLLMLLTAVDAGLGACFFGIPVDRLGTCDDCGFSPFGDDTSTSRETAFAKIRARVQGTQLASKELGIA